jgi:sugar phosphate isomerase/epimerase
MKLCYGVRRGTFHPFPGEGMWTLPRGDTRTRYLRHVKGMGFDGMELGAEMFGGMDATEEQSKELQSILRDGGVPCVAIHTQAGGELCSPKVARANRERLENAVKIAGWIGAEIVSTALRARPRNRTDALGATGGVTSHDSSQTATQEDFVRTANVLREVGEMAGAIGAKITVEIGQHSLADNSWSTIHLLELTGSPHVFANPDLGNIYKTYDVPEETNEEAVLALAPYTRYWHCKNMRRVHVPEVDRSYFIWVPLPDGDLDYRFAIAAMNEAGFDGYLVVEGATEGDHLYKDRRSVDYVREILAEL